MRSRVVVSGVGPGKPMPAPTPVAPVTSAAPPPRRNDPVIDPHAVARNPFDSVAPGVPPVAPVAPQVAEPLAVPVSALESGTRSAEWVRQTLPSLMVPYSFSQVWLRPIDVDVLSLLDAAHRNNSFTILLDALNHCIDVDIRSLTPSDFYFVMYWIRDNSYPRRALKLKWTSQYGNRNEVHVRLSKKPADPDHWREMRIVELAMTPEDYAGYQSQGLTFPTVRDMEILKGGSVSDADLWRVEYAQYVAPTPPEDPARPWDNYLQRKLNAFKALGLDGVTHIDAFSNAIAHGVQEFLHVYDTEFDVLKTIEHKQTTIVNLVEAVKNILHEDPENLYTPTLTALLAAVEKEKEKLDAMVAAVNAGDTVQPEEEVITLDIVVMDFFPETFASADSGDD